MPYIITHHDADGILSAATLIKAMQIRFWVYFSSPNKLLTTICTTLLNSGGNDSLYICDISGNRKSICCAAAYNEVVWLDHHVWENLSIPENIKLVVDKDSKSATRVVGNYTGVMDFVEIADEIDTNNLETETAERLRSLTFAIKMLSPKEEIYRALYEFTMALVTKGIGVVYSPGFDELLHKYNLILEAGVKNAILTKKDFMFGDRKVAVIFLGNELPVAPVFNKLKDEGIDIVIFIGERADEISGYVTKLEFRTQTGFDVLKIAEEFGGGGHIQASGATVRNKLKIEDVLAKIKSVYGW
ncbi:MAG: DHHA1 domain-containing protein [Thermoplasmata archaeon]